MKLPERLLLVLLAAITVYQIVKLTGWLAS